MCYYQINIPHICHAVLVAPVPSAPDFDARSSEPDLDALNSEPFALPRYMLNHQAK
jgi:hypothetical protein